MSQIVIVRPFRKSDFTSEFRLQPDTVGEFSAGEAVRPGVAAADNWQLTERRISPAQLGEAFEKLACGFVREAAANPACEL